ncbi:retrovirus-related pol polyprotein from transposon TNT 1-94 [Tanacetum coccineum]
MNKQLASDTTSLESKSYYKKFYENNKSGMEMVDMLRDVHRFQGKAIFASLHKWEEGNILVIVDDYSRYTWTLFLRSKDETPEVLKDFLMMIQRNLQAQVITVRTDRGTEFLNKNSMPNSKKRHLDHKTSILNTSDRSGVVERRNRTLVEAARTMLSASKLPLSFWAEAVATHETSINIFTSLVDLFLTMRWENLDKMKKRGSMCPVGYSTQSKGYSVYQTRETRLIVSPFISCLMKSKEMMYDNNSYRPRDIISTRDVCWKMSLQPRSSKDK